MGRSKKDIRKEREEEESARIHWGIWTKPSARCVILKTYHHYQEIITSTIFSSANHGVDSGHRTRPFSHSQLCLEPYLITESHQDTQSKMAFEVFCLILWDELVTGRVDNPKAAGTGMT